MSDNIDDGGQAFPRTVQRWNDSLDHSVQGMSLRDCFATCIDKDEYGDIIYKHLSMRASEVLAGAPRPEEPTDAEKCADPDANVKYQISKVAWEFKWRAVLRYMMADAMLAARKASS